MLVSGALALLAGVRPAGIGPAELAALGLGVVAVALVDGGYSFLLGCSRFRLQGLVTASSSWVYAAALLALWAGGGITVTSAAIAWTAGLWLRALFVFWSCARFNGLGRPSLSLLRESIAFGCRAWIGSLARFANFRAEEIAPSPRTFANIRRWDPSCLRAK